VGRGSRYRYSGVDAGPAAEEEWAEVEHRERGERAIVENFWLRVSVVPYICSAQPLKNAISAQLNCGMWAQNKLC